MDTPVAGLGAVFFGSSFGRFSASDLWIDPSVDYSCTGVNFSNGSSKRQPSEDIGDKIASY